jgi:hypothetical protein
MRRLLCQVCGGAADRDDRGILWLLGEPERGWSGEQLTAQPPVCLRCARTASRVCPHLSEGLLAMRVRHAPVSGVTGGLYRYGRDAPFFLGPASLGYDDPRVRFLQARQLMRGLYDWILVDLDQELAESAT